MRLEIGRISSRWSAGKRGSERDCVELIADLEKLLPEALTSPALALLPRKGEEGERQDRYESSL